MHHDLKHINNLVYTPRGLTLSAFKADAEGKAYGACSYRLEDKNILQRFSKITPTKIGQFVTLWKRNSKGITEPFNSSDNFDFVIITARQDKLLGQFVFPKTVLAEKGILTHNYQTGKRGFRVYPPWDTVTNKQAQQTQNWQAPYFYFISETTAMDLTWVAKCFSSN